MHLAVQHRGALFVPRQSIVPRLDLREEIVLFLERKKSGR